MATGYEYWLDEPNSGELALYGSVLLDLINFTIDNNLAVTHIVILYPIYDFEFTNKIFIEILIKIQRAVRLISYDSEQNFRIFILFIH